MKPRLVDLTLGPGDFWFGGGYTRVHTLLGSCIAITVWHPTRLLGGMCHYLLPLRGADRRLTHGHYADDAVSLIADAVTKEWTEPKEYIVKLFGGGNMFESLGYADTVSRANIETGIELLRKAGFTVMRMDVGGSRYRKIYLELWSGDVWVQRGTTRPSSN